MSAEKDMREFSLVNDATPVRGDLRAGAVDAWLRRGLAARYDVTLDEALPPEMVALLNTMKH